MTYRELIKVYNETLTIAESQYIYIQNLEGLLSENNINVSDIENSALKGDDYESYTLARKFTLKNITNAVSRFYDVDVEHIFGVRQFRSYVVCRQVICYIAKNNMAGFTLKKTGSYLGNRDHSTVIHSVQSCRNEMSYNKKFNREIEEITELLKL